MIKTVSLLFSFLFVFVAARGFGMEAPFVTATATDVGTEFVSICYHDSSSTAYGDAFNVKPKDLAEQFEYIKAHYNVISLDDIILANQGKKMLPPKAVLITIDDGLSSFYQNYFPLIKLYKFKVVFAVVGKWIERGFAKDYGIPTNKDNTIVNWEQLKEVHDSGLVDVVSHSYNLHQGVLFNPQGNEGQSGGFFSYNPQLKKYETDLQFYNRISSDLKQNNELLKKHLGKVPPVMVWPYGSFNGVSQKAAEELGLKIQFSVQEGINTTKDISIIKRGMVMSNMRLADFATALERGFVIKEPIRALSINLDELYDNDPQKTNQNLGQLLERILVLGVNTVYLQAYSTIDSNKVYFPNSVLEVKSDLLNRVAHTIARKTKALYVFAIMPSVLNIKEEQYRSLFTDLAKYTDLVGIIFNQNDEGNHLIDTKIMTTVIAEVKKMRPLWTFGLLFKTLEVLKTNKDSVLSLDHLIYQINYTHHSLKPKVAEQREYRNTVVELLNKITELNSNILKSDLKKWIIQLENRSEDRTEIQKNVEAAHISGFANLSFSPQRFQSVNINELRPIFSSSYNPFEFYKGEIR